MADPRVIAKIHEQIQRLGGRLVPDDEPACRDIPHFFGRAPTGAVLCFLLTRVDWPLGAVYHSGPECRLDVWRFHWGCPLTKADWQAMETDEPFAVIGADPSQDQLLVCRLHDDSDDPTVYLVDYTEPEMGRGEPYSDFLSSLFPGPGLETDEAESEI